MRWEGFLLLIKTRILEKELIQFYPKFVIYSWPIWVIVFFILPNLFSLYLCLEKACGYLSKLASWKQSWFNFILNLSSTTTATIIHCSQLIYFISVSREGLLIFVKTRILETKLIQIYPNIVIYSWPIWVVLFFIILNLYILYLCLEKACCYLSKLASWKQTWFNFILNCHLQLTNLSYAIFHYSQLIYFISVSQEGLLLFVETRILETKLVRKIQLLPFFQKEKKILNLTQFQTECEQTKSLCYNPFMSNLHQCLVS